MDPESLRMWTDTAAPTDIRRAVSGSSAQSSSRRKTKNQHNFLSVSWTAAEERWTSDRNQLPLVDELSYHPSQLKLLTFKMYVSTFVDKGIANEP